MLYFNEINYWQNKNRLKFLTEFRHQVNNYFQNSESDWMVNARIENDTAVSARRKINQTLDKADLIISLSGVSPVIHYSSPPAIGGYRQNVDVILNIFNLYDFQIGPKAVYDMIDRAIGIYEENRKISIFRTFNPFFWINLLIKYIISIPFKILGIFGFDHKSFEITGIGQFIKGILYLITVFASLVTLINFFDLKELLKKYFNNAF